MTAPGDSMAACIRQLLELDESSRRETLQSLSQYVESNSMWSGPGVSDSREANLPHVAMMAAGLNVAGSSGRASDWPSTRDMRSEQFQPQKVLNNLTRGSSASMPQTIPDLARAGNIWSTELPVPSVFYEETQSQPMQGLRASPLLWESQAIPTPVMLPLSGHSVPHIDAGKYKALEEQRQQQLPSAGVAHRSGHTHTDAGGASCDSKASTLIEIDANAQQWGEPPFSGADGEESSLRSYLNYLKQIDSGRILLVRKINHLGFDSAAVLTSHYTAYGSVEHVFVPRSRSVARSQSNRPFVRKRPSGIGFVVMGECQAVDAILQDGEAQSVGGVTVYLQRFRRQSFPDEVEEAL